MTPQFIVGPETMRFNGISSPILDATLKIIAAHNERRDGIMLNHEEQVRRIIAATEVELTELVAMTTRKIVEASVARVS